MDAFFYSIVSGISPEKNGITRSRLGKLGLKEYVSNKSYSLTRLVLVLVWLKVIWAGTITWTRAQTCVLSCDAFFSLPRG